MTGQVVSINRWFILNQRIMHEKRSDVSVLVSQDEKVNKKRKSKPKEMVAQNFFKKSCSKIIYSKQGLKLWLWTPLYLIY